MNIIDAIKSGKRFRLAGTTGWHSANDPEDVGFRFFKLTARQIISEDWEIEKPTQLKVSITEFDDAVLRVINLVKKELNLD